MVDAIQVSSGTEIIDLKTGKLTRQGLYILQSVANTQDALNTHEAFAATSAALGHVKQGSAVTDATASTVAVSSADITAAPASYNQTWGEEVETLANEAKADVNSLVTDLNNTITKLNSLLSSLETAGIISS